MAPLERETAARVCRIAADLSALEPRLLEGPLLREPAKGAGKRYSLGGALASLWQAPTQALAYTLFGGAEPAAGGRLCMVESELVGPQGGRRGMVWLAWDDCRCLFQVFRALEYVDATGKPTSLVGTHVSRLAAGETVGAQEDSGGRARRGSTHDAQVSSGSSVLGAARLWGWSSNSTSDGAAGGDSSEEQVQSAAWTLISRVFARATALRISADAEEVSESDAQAVLTWFPQLEYLEVQRIPHAALRFWSSWLPPTLCGLKMVYAGFGLDAALGLAEGGREPWQRLELLDLSDNPGIDLEPLRGPLAQQRLPALARLSLARCELDCVPDVLATLYSLAWLDLRSNAIADVADISLRVGGIARLCLARNGLADISGLRRLWALEVLDVSGNALAEWTAVLPLRNLPSLRELAVDGNPLVQAGGAHRVQIFSAFDHRDVALALDGRGPTGQERREMAKVARVATEHRAGAPTAPAEPATMGRRHKVAVIEESDAGATDDAGDSAVANTAAAAEDHQPDGTQNVTTGTVAPEKTPRVLRASELQAVATASAHRRGKVGAYLLSGPGVLAKARGHFRRRATATTLGGAAGVDIARGPKRQATYSVPATYGARPASPVPSMLAPSITGSLRDPERYRRRVEMMRAEAGSSWLRAFTELQAQTPSPHAASPSSPPAHLPAVGEDDGDADIETAPASGPADGAGPAAVPRPAETVLPTSLFPRRKQAAHKDIARLPHYPRADTPQAATADRSPLPANSTADAGDGTGEAGGGHSDTASEHSDRAPTAEAQPDELQQLLQGEGVKAALGDVEVVRFRLVAPAEGGGSSAVERIDCGRRTIYITATDVVEVADDGNGAGDMRIAARVPLSALVRGRPAGSGGELVEAKADRFEAPQWIMYGCGAGGVAD
ncbi:hypothetical protein H4R19_004681, partial [Coemansia spiralis]